MIGGVVAFGAVGLLLGPLMMTAFLTLAGIYREHYRPFIGKPCAEGASEAKSQSV